LKEQEARGLKGRDLYTSYANRGTFLIHGNFRAAQKGDSGAKERLREGLGYIGKSIEVNPEAHFGREVWQAVAVEFLLAVIDDPQILLEYDLVGNELDTETGNERAMRSKTGSHAARNGTRVSVFLREGGPPKERKRLRKAITPVERLQESVPFDEPVLGIIGMWRLGGGPNPHFALALGECMRRVGQRRIAWCAYERAVRMADRFWPDVKIQKGLIAHCRNQQAMLVEDLSEEERAALPERFDAELRHGLRYQEAYQRYEQERIAAGASLGDAHFYDSFHAYQGDIASPVDDADYFVVHERTLLAQAAGPLLFGGAFAFGYALLRRWSIVLAPRA
jgi:hypothetical protein